MKYLMLTLLFSSNAFSKDIINYNCDVDKNLKIEISLLDKNSPMLNLFYNNSKFAECSYESTAETRPVDPKAHIQVAEWHLRLKKCSYIFDKYKSKIDLMSEVTFKQYSGATPSYLMAITGIQPILCRALKLAR